LKFDSLNFRYHRPLPTYRSITSAVVGGVRGIWLPEGFAIGWGVSEALAAFVASLATGHGSHDDPAKTVMVPAGGISKPIDCS
jgi:hypothetical protein